MENIKMIRNVNEVNEILETQPNGKNIVTINDDYAEIQISKCLTTIVDIEHIDVIRRFTWAAQKNNKKTTYFSVNTNILRYNGKQIQKLTLAQLIMILNFGYIPYGMEIDHKDRDPLNNRLDNLRFATRKEQCINRDKSRLFGRNKKMVIGYSPTASVSL